MPFFAAGRFGRPSASNGDVTIEARAGKTLVGSVAVMVRIRKNANTLTTAERDRFVAAFAQLNNQGMGRFADFRDMHTNVARRRPTARRASCRGIAPTCSISSASCRRSTRASRCRTGGSTRRRPTSSRSTSSACPTLGTVRFSNSNPLQFWRTDGVQGINRRPFFNTGTAPPGLLHRGADARARHPVPRLPDHGGQPARVGAHQFRRLISSIATAARDPLFFLLHCNVDRLWAKWQRQNGRFNPALAASYDSRGAHPIGHNLADTMWPWNGITGSPRPPTAPGGALAASPCQRAGTAAAGRSTPRLPGRRQRRGALGFDYDDVASDALASRRHRRMATKRKAGEEDAAGSEAGGHQAGRLAQDGGAASRRRRSPPARDGR